MKIALLADIHGNLPALEAVLSHAENQSIDRYLVAGDSVVGPQPNEVYQQLWARQAIMIQGNNEVSMLGFANNTLPQAWWTHKQFGFARASFHLLNMAVLQTIAGLPEQRTICLDGAAPLRLVHGSPRRVNELLYPERDLAPLAEALHSIPELVLLCGHTHIPWVNELEGKLAVNPGAVTGGLNCDPSAQYAILEWDGQRWQAALHAVDYDRARIEAAYRDSGLLAAGSAFARACLASFRNGQNIPQVFVDFAYDMARRAGWQGEFVPDDLWDAAENSFDFSV